MTHPHSPRHIVVSIIATIVLTAVTLSTPLASTAAPVAAAAAAAVDPVLTVTPVVTGLTAPWDLTFTPDRSMLYTLKGGSIYVRTPAGVNRELTADFADLFVGSETGLMGIVVDPAYSTNRQIYTCQGHSGPTDIRVIKWTVDAAMTTATRVGAPLVTGLPVSSGRHGGCRLRFDNAGLLYISTGDAAVGTNPQDLTSLGGKVLRVTTSGAPAPGNPFLDSTNSRTKLIYTYGHRNVQGLALRPGTDQMWSVEQGTGRDDEVNRLIAKTNYGYDPIPNSSSDPAYNESVPMTDKVKFPKAKAAIFTTGPSTLALSGGTWLSGAQWGRLNGTFVAAALKAKTVRVLTITGTETLSKVESMAVLDQDYGRLRSPQLGPDGALYISTSNGTNDQILKVTAQPGAGDSRCLTRTNPSPSTVGLAKTNGGVRLYVVTTTGSVSYRRDSGPGPFISLAGGTRYGASAVSWDGVRTDVFITGRNGNLYQKYNNGSSWNASWVNLGGALTSSPMAISFGSRSLVVLARGSNNQLMMKRFTGSSWTGWSSLGGILTAAPGAAVDGASGTARVGVRATDGTLRYLTLRADGTPASGFVNTGVGICSAPAYAVRPGATDRFPYSYVDADGETFVVRSGIAKGLGSTVTGSVALITSGVSGFAVFGRGPGDALYRYDARSGSAAWKSLGGTLR